jgi:hypothetical protein
MPRYSGDLSADEREQLYYVIEELNSRGIPVPTEYYKKVVKWPVDRNGYFSRLDGRFYNPNENHKKFLDSNARFVGLISGRGGGKALAIDTPIPTVDGWKLMKDVSVGDKVFDENGNQTLVIWTSSIMYGHKCYQISFSDGSQIIADADHEWKVYCKYDKSYRILTTEILSKRKLKSGNDYGYSVDVSGKLSYNTKSLPIHPYVLGVWLGDGSKRDAKITCGDQEIVDRIQGIGYPIHPTSEYMSYSLSDYGGNKKDIQKLLRNIGVLNNKRIPRMYLESDVNQRIELLYGLMDTDGSISLKGHCCFDNQNRELIDDVYELVTSLGIKSTIKSYDATLNGVKTGTTYKIAFTPNITVFSLSRKRHKQRYRKQFYRRGMVCVQELDTIPVKCIRVQSENKLFVAGRACIPTHNSAVGSQKALRKIMEGQSGAVLNPDF